MVDEVVVGEIPQIIAVEFGIGQFLSKVKGKSTAGFSKIEGMTIPAYVTFVFIFVAQIAQCSTSRQIIGVLFVKKTEQSCAHIGIVVAASAQYTGIDETDAGVVFQGLIQYKNIVIGQWIGLKLPNRAIFQILDNGMLRAGNGIEDSNTKSIFGASRNF
jgi:hypothetical protein